MEWRELSTGHFPIFAHSQWLKETVHPPPQHWALNGPALVPMPSNVHPGGNSLAAIVGAYWVH